MFRIQQLAKHLTGQHLPRLMLLAAIALVATGRGLSQDPGSAAAAGISTAATVSPTSAAAGGSVAITAQATSSAAMTGLVDIEVYSTTKVRFYQQYWDNQTLQAGQPLSLSATWAVPAEQPAGTYSVQVGVFSPGWGTTLARNSAAAQIAVTSTAPATYTMAATASPATVAAGASTALNLQVATSATITALVDLEVYNAAGTKVFQQYWDNQQITATPTAPFLAAQHIYTATWAVPATQQVGTYTLRAGLFKPGWGSQLSWNSNAGQLTVSGVGTTPTATPAPSATPSPTPSPTATPSATATPTPIPGGNGSPAGGVHVSGNQLVNRSGQPVRLHAVNRSGSEYACVQGWGIFDGPSDAGSVSAIASWKVNAVRVPLNEDCWLGINGVPAAYSGANYQQAIAGYVNTITGAGMAAILDLHWTAPGTTPATAQTPMPDLDHSPAFWNQVPNTFKGNQAVIFELFNEPFAGNSQASTADWACWRDGGTCADVAYPVAGMQTLVNSVRQAGATNTILLGGMAWSNDLSQWLAYEPTDSGRNLGAAWHVYNYNACGSLSCYTTVVAPVAATVPVVATEIGEDDCSGAFISPLMAWLDSQWQSYAAWTWDTWGTACGSYSLITSYAGAATSPYGQTYHDHLASLP
jgi:hypothetical protein